jgi:hypothetical protein
LKFKKIKSNSKHNISLKFIIRLSILKKYCWNSEIFSLGCQTPFCFFRKKKYFSKICSTWVIGMIVSCFKKRKRKKSLKKLSYVIHGANPKNISQVNVFMWSLIFIIGPQISDFVTDLMTLHGTKNKGSNYDRGWDWAWDWGGLYG